jgi:hypothetical protein
MRAKNSKLSWIEIKAWKEFKSLSWLIEINAWKEVKILSKAEQWCVEVV